MESILVSNRKKTSIFGWEKTVQENSTPIFSWEMRASHASNSLLQSLPPISREFKLPGRSPQKCVRATCSVPHLFCQHNHTSAEDGCQCWIVMIENHLHYHCQPLIDRVGLGVFALENIGECGRNGDCVGVRRKRRYLANPAPKPRTVAEACRNLCMIRTTVKPLVYCIAFALRQSITGVS